MAYTIYKADGTTVNVTDNTIDQTFYDQNANGAGKGIGQRLIGKSAIGYGAAIAQNFLQLTENYCGTVMPSDTTALQGQLWFNKVSGTSGDLYVRNSAATTGAMNNWTKILTQSALSSGSGSSLVGYDPIITYSANTVGAELRVAQSQVEHFWKAIRNNQRDIYVIVTGDSTGNENWEWVYLMAQWLATECPTHTIKYRLFNDITTSWDAYSTLQTGTGPGLPYTGTPFTIFIDNGSVAGTNTFYTQGARASAFWTGIDYDLTIVNYGHNLGTAMTEYIAMPEWVIELAYLKLMAPRAGLLVTLQNPRESVTSDINTNGSAQSARMVAAWRKAVDLVGGSIIDVYTAFKTAPNYAALMADETHPNAAGQLVWVKEVKRVMAEPIRMTGDAPLVYNPLVETKSNLAPNPKFSNWIGSSPDNWTFTNCTPTKDLGKADGSLYSMKVTIGAGLNPAITADVSSYISMIAGQTVTFVARLWRPSTLNLLGGRIEILTTDNVSSSASFISYPRGIPSSGGWELAIATLTVPRNHTQATIKIYGGAADGSDSGKSFWISGVWLGVGWMPGTASNESGLSQFVTDYYSDGNVGKITGNTGTLTVSGTTITLVGSPTTNSDVYINLPGLTPGKNYRFTFNADSCTGNVGGGVYVRNGFNGGFTTITTGTWTAGSGASVTFTAPNGPVSLWVYGYTGTTGWQISSTSITPTEGVRILGDFSNATVANRTMFQTSTTNGNTSVAAVPNGTAINAGFAAFGGNSNPDNASFVSFSLNGGVDARINSSITGTGTYLPMTFYTGGLEQLRILTTGGITSANLADAVGYKGLPINEQSTNYGLQLTDQGRCIFHPITDNNARTYTIPANGSIPFPVGTTITFVNLVNTITIAITTDTLYLTGSGATGSRTLAAFGMATAIKMSSTTWIISGNGLT